MLTAIITAAIIAAIQTFFHRLSGARMRELEARLANISITSHEYAADAREHARDAAETSADLREMLRPALAQLPKTRSRKAKAAPTEPPADGA